MNRQLARLGALLCVAFTFAALAAAQSTGTGTVTGLVTDAQGKAITGAAVVLTNTNTNAALASITNDQGRYVFTNVQPGPYSLDVKKAGFNEAAVKNQTVEVSKTLTLNVPMKVGVATQTVEVTASGAELQTMNATVGSTVSGAAIVALPNLGRDANALTMLQPNTAPDGGIAGADLDQNSYTLDGGNNSDEMDGAHSVYTPSSGSIGTGAGGNPSGVIPTPADSIEQFSVGVNNQTANMNGAAGSSVAMVTKRGTNTVHGSAYEYYLGSKLSANSWDNNRTGQARPKSHQNRFGASLGGQILPDFLGGKTYVFGLFEGRRYPLTQTVTRADPSDLLRAGVVQALDTATGAWTPFNLKPATVIVDGKAYAPAVCTQPGGGTGACDPRGLGLNPVVAQLWKQYMPPANNTKVGGDHHNSLGFTGQVATPLQSNFFVTRIDHDFGAKNHLMVSYHFYSYNPTTTNQLDIGGALPGDTLGHIAARTERPELPSMWSAGLTTSASPNLTNDLHYSYLRNYWQWGGTITSPQVLTGFGPLGGALELGGETTNALIPYNVNTQSVRTRFWDGIGNTVRDDVTYLHGNHIFQFGGQYTHQWDYHQRNDNGGGIMAANIYQMGAGQGVANSFVPVGFTGPTGTYKTFYNEVLGIVSQPQTLFTRSGPTLALQPLGTPMFDKSYIPMYNAYFSDAWHLRPSLTLTYGAGYTVEMPPHEQDGKQVMLVDSAGNPISTADYLATTERLNLGGQDFNPTLGFATVQNVGGGRKYPYHPFYGGFSPRVSLAWNPGAGAGPMEWLLGRNQTVIRGGWARIYGRLNGVDLVLVPLLGTGLGQAIACIGATHAGTGLNSCNGVGGADPSTAFRIGVDGLTAPLPTASPTLPQPYFPGTIQAGVANPAAGAGEVLDPNFRPNRSDEFDLTVQRQLTNNFSTEIGYTGRIIRNEYQAINLDAVPHLLTAGGQRFDKAFAAVWLANQAGGTATPQPFFESALGGPTSAYCKGFASCTAAVQANEVAAGNISSTGNDVFSMWSDLNSSPSWTLGRTFPGAPTTCSTPGAGVCPATGIISGGGQVQAIYENLSDGYGNYNALFWSVQMRNWHNLTALSNFTWSRAFGTGQVVQATSEYTVVDPFNLGAMYGPQYNDTPLNYNLYFVYQPGAKTQSGWAGHLLNGWSFAPILTWHNGINAVDITNNGGNTDCASFGETDCVAGSSNETAVKIRPYNGGTGITRGVVTQNAAGEAAGVGVNSDPANQGSGINQYGNNAVAVYNGFRPMVLGLDTTGTSGVIPGFGVWNVSFALSKDILAGERWGADISAQAANVFNHFQANSGAFNYNGLGASNDIGNPAAFGVITTSALTARQLELGLRLHW